MSRTYQIWSYIALSVMGAGVVRSFVIEPQPPHHSGEVVQTDLGNPMDVVTKMRWILTLYNDNGRDLSKLSDSVRRYVGDGSSFTSFVIPPEAAHSDVAIFYQGFYDPDCRIVKHQVRCSPYGSFLVLYKGDPRIYTVDAEAVRVAGSGKTTHLVFRATPGKAERLRPLPEYEQPLYLPSTEPHQAIR